VVKKAVRRWRLPGITDSHFRQRGWRKLSDFGMSLKTRLFSAARFNAAAFNRNLTL
jgi:hypothetical protein